MADISVTELANYLGSFVLAIGALGTAAFGVVEGLKRSRTIGEAGFPAITTTLKPIWPLLTKAYGKDVEALLRAQYRGNQQDLAKIIRQGARVGLSDDNAMDAANGLGVVEPRDLVDVATAIRAGTTLTEKQRSILGRFELAADARIEASLALAQDNYARAAKITASVVAIVIAVGVVLYLYNGDYLPLALVVGLAAVPLAPIAKDVAAGIKAAADALRGRK